MGHIPIMKQWTFVLCLLGACSALPILPHHAGIPGMGSISLEGMRQLGGPSIPKVLPQYGQTYSYADPFNSMWMHNFLPSHSSFYLIRQRPQHETQQYEYTMPVHPPPLPSQTPTLLQQPGIQDQPHYHYTHFLPTRQVQIQHYDIQPPFHPKQLSLSEGNQPDVQQQLSLDRHAQQLPAIQDYSGTLSQIYPGLFGTQQNTGEQPQQRSIYPNLQYMSYVTNKGAPTRLGIVSSEEMQDGGFGAPAYRAAGPHGFPMDGRFGNMPLNSGQPGDYTVEDDQLGITEQPEVPKGVKLGPNPPNRGNNVIPVDINPRDALPNANNNLLNPAGQSKGQPNAPQATALPPATPDSFIPLEETSTAMRLDPTMFPDSFYSTSAGNEAGQPQVSQSSWHMQEP
ncbi:ameloblastin [Notechis scutatus]|uniref:Ameloblastin n=1 Tax=Notechis scutatus TaxID=8663 RepID=A0A6J1UCH4_9SAUR|nr:ameloblastin [Notechis scutatus]